MIRPVGGQLLIFSFSILNTPPKINSSALPPVIVNSDRDLDTLCGTKLGFEVQVAVAVLTTLLISRT